LQIGDIRQLPILVTPFRGPKPRGALAPRIINATIEFIDDYDNTWWRVERREKAG
jgi:hypothetical protein